MALNRRELLQAGAVAGLSTVFASTWALGSPTDSAAVTAAGWLPPAAGRHALLQGDDLDPGAYEVEAAVPSGDGLSQITRHVFDGGFVEEQLSSWDATGVRLERLRVSFVGIGDVVEFTPAPRVLGFGPDDAEWTVSGSASGAPYSLAVRQRAVGGELDVRRRLELRRDAGLTVVEQHVRLAPATRLPVRGSTVVLAEDAEALEWTLLG